MKMSPAQIRKAGRRRLITLIPPKAARMVERLVEDIFTALDEQTVVVPGTDAAALIVPSLAGSLTAVLDQRELLAARIEEVWENHLLSKVLTSMPGASGPEPGSSSTSATAVHSPPPPPRRLRRTRPGNPKFGLLDPRRTTLQTRKQAAQTGLLPLRVRRPGRLGLPHLLRQEDRPGKAPHPSPPLPRQSASRSAVRDAPRRRLLRVPGRHVRLILIALTTGSTVVFVDRVDHDWVTAVVTRAHALNNRLLHRRSITHESQSAWRTHARHRPDHLDQTRRSLPRPWERVGSMPTTPPR